MLKKLLYLYNDGHNPFPKLGKGGLGYHLPQYKIRGGAVSYNADGTMNYDGNDTNDNVYNPIGKIIGTYKKINSHELAFYDPNNGMVWNTDIPDINTTNIGDKKPEDEDKIDFMNQQIKKLDKIIGSKKTVIKDIEPIMNKVEELETTILPTTEEYKPKPELSQDKIDEIDKEVNLFTRPFLIEILKTNYNRTNLSRLKKSELMEMLREEMIKEEIKLKPKVIIPIPETEPIPIPKTEPIPIIEGKKTVKEDIEPIMEKVEKLESKPIMGKVEKIEPKIEKVTQLNTLKPTNNVNQDELSEKIESNIDYYEKKNKVTINPNDKDLIRQKIKDDYMATKSNNKYINIYLDNVQDAIKHFEIEPIKDINEDTVKKFMEELQQKTLEEQTEFLDDNYNSIYQYYKNIDSRPGKGYELFLCEGIGSNMIKSFVEDDNIEILNFDKSEDVPDDKKQYCAVDMLYKNPKTNKGGIGEIKDYTDKDMEDYDNPESNFVAVQASKLCGNSFPGTNSNFDIIFGKDDETGEYYIIDIRYQNKPISQGVDIADYLVSVNAKNNTWICDLMKQKSFVKKYINDNTMTETKMSGLYVVDKDKIPKTYDKVSGSKNPIQSIRIKNKYFKPQNKKK
jgi:hypothetical protein